MRDYGQLLVQLLPPGAIWDNPGPVLQSILDSIAPEFARIDARGIDLEAEMDPSTATELLGEWETALGLPDADCAATYPTTITGRRLAASARFRARGNNAGGTGILFLSAVAAALGYTGTDFQVRRFHRLPLTCQSKCNASLNTRDAGWLSLYEFIVTHGDVDEQLQCEIDRSMSAHLEPTFAFPLVQFSDMAFTRSTPSTFTHPITGETTSLAVDEPGRAYLGV